MKQPSYHQQHIADLDSQIIEKLRHGLPICTRPYWHVANELALGEMALILRIQHLSNEKRIRRYPPLREIKHLNLAEVMLTQWDKQLITLLRKGLPLTSRPFHVLAKQLDLSVDEVLFRSERLRDTRYIGLIQPAV